MSSSKFFTSFLAALTLTLGVGCTLPYDANDGDTSVADDDVTTDDDTSSSDDDVTTDDDTTVSDDDSSPVADDDTSQSDDDTTVSDDDSTPQQDDDVTADDDTTPVSDDDTSISDDDSTPQQDDDVTADDDATPTSDDDTVIVVGDDDTTVASDDDTSAADDDATPVSDDDTSQSDDDTTTVSDDDTVIVVGDDDSAADDDLATDDDSAAGDDDTTGDDDSAADDDTTPEPEVDTDGDGYMESDGDCDNSDPAVHPDAPETMDWRDNDCDLLVDEGCDVSCGWDYVTVTDGSVCRDDLYQFWASGNTDLSWECVGETWREAIDGDGDSYTTENDCNDANADIHPGAAELFNWVDEDCDGTPDDGCDLSCNWDYISVDEAGMACRDDRYSYWETGSFTWACTNTSWEVEVDADGDGYTVAGGDCAEGDATVHPGALELQDWKDNDCDGTPDDGCNGGCGWDYVSVDADGTVCRDDVYAAWVSGYTDFTWVCTGETWRSPPP